VFELSGVHLPRIFELPTHLEVEDQLVAGLTARQLLRPVIGGSLGYGAWDQLPWVPQEVRVLPAVILAGVGAVFALLQLPGRVLEFSQIKIQTPESVETRMM
jgi:hypothetical protein